MRSGEETWILLADDDADDRMLTRDALTGSRFIPWIREVTDGEELMDYLHRRGTYSDPARAPRPSLILLDLNMPRKDGREALREIKEDPALRRIPVVVMTTSSSPEDVAATYDLGTNSYIQKPSTFAELVEVLRTVGDYWFEVVRLPREGAAAHGAD